MSEVFVGTALAMVNELAQNYVLRRRYLASSIQERAAPTCIDWELCHGPVCVAGNHEVDLIARGRIDHVELPTKFHGFLGCDGAIT